MNLKEKRKFVAEYAKKANEILQDVENNSPEFLTNRWNGVFSKVNKYTTKKGTFRQSAPYKMNTEQLKKFMETLSNFVREMERKTREKEKYSATGFGESFGFVDSLSSEFYNYYYAGGYDEWYTRTKSVLEIMAESEDITPNEAIHIIETAFYKWGDYDAPKEDKPRIENTGYFSEIEQGGKYL